MKILITGSRTCNDINAIFTSLTNQVNQNDILIHGGAKGVDSIAQSWADNNKVCTIIVKPIYPSKKEYYLHRNAEMVGMCDKVIAFWDGKSRGTRFTIIYAKKRDIKTSVVCL